MTESNLPAEDPTAETTAAQPAETSTRKASRTRMWLSGTALVAAGVVAGSGATYAVSVHSVSGATQQQASGVGRQGGPGGGFGPGGQGEGGGTPPSGAPSGNAQPSDTQTG